MEEFDMDYLRRNVHLEVRSNCMNTPIKKKLEGTQDTHQQITGSVKNVHIELMALRKDEAMWLKKRSLNSLVASLRELQSRPSGSRCAHSTSNTESPPQEKDIQTASFPSSFLKDR
jgi:hypothetical protein